VIVTENQPDLREKLKHFSPSLGLMGAGVIFLALGSRTWLANQVPDTAVEIVTADETVEVGDEAEIKKAMEAVAAQGKAK